LGHISNRFLHLLSVPQKRPSHSALKIYSIIIKKSSLRIKKKQFLNGNAEKQADSGNLLRYQPIAGQESEIGQIDDAIAVDVRPVTIIIVGIAAGIEPA
jgi:hypothetical protein